MGTLVVATGAPGQWNSKIAFPVMRGLKGYYTFDTDAARFGFNRAPGGVNAIMTGAPVAFATHGRFNGQVNFLDTGIAETIEQTIIVVGKSAAVVPSGSTQVDQPYYVGNAYGSSVNPPYVGKTSTGVDLYHPDNARVSGSAARDNGSGDPSSAAASLAATPANSWAIRAVRASGAAANVVMDLTAGTQAAGTNTNPRILNDKTFRIGGAALGNSALVDISAVAILEVALTDSEINVFAEAMRKRMLRFGIVV